MRLDLTKEQASLVEQGLNKLERDLKEQMKDQPPAVADMVRVSLFQLELLTTWFDRQRELG